MSTMVRKMADGRDGLALRTSELGKQVYVDNRAVSMQRWDGQVNLNDILHYYQSESV